MPDDTSIPSTPLPPGLSSVTEPTLPATPEPMVPPATPPVVPPPTPTPPQPTVPEVDLSAVASAKVDKEALAGLASSLSETPQTAPVMPPSETLSPPQVIAPTEPDQQKKSGGKTSAIIGGLFLLIVLPVSAYYVSQKVDIMRTLSLAKCQTGIGGQSECNAGTTSGKNSLGKDFNTLSGGGDVSKAGRNLNLQQEVDKSDVKKAVNTVAVVTAAPTAVPTATLTPTETPTSTPTETPTGTPVPTSGPASPGVCDASCETDSNCQSGFVCATIQEGIKRCRRPDCKELFTCVCPAATSTVTPTPKPVVAVATTPTATPTPKVPVAGVPSVLGASTIAGGILLLLIGLLL